MKPKLLTLITLLATSIYAQEPEYMKPQEPNIWDSKAGKIYDSSEATHQPQNGNQVILPCLKGVILTDGSAVSAKEKQLSIGNLGTLNIKIPGKVQALQSLLSKQFLNKPLTKHHLIELKKTILDFYRRHGRPVVTLQIPQQKITDGVLEILVIEGKLGDIHVEGNTYFKSNTIRGYVRLNEGNPIDSDILLTDLTWINRNPFRHVDAIFKPGEANGTTDITLLVKDRRPWRVYTGVDNTGYDKTDFIRLFTGANWGKVFGLDHDCSIQYTQAPNPSHFWALTTSYSIPLPWRHILTFYGGYSHTHPKSTTFKDSNGVLQTKPSPSGSSIQGSTRYNVILNPVDTYLQDITVGFDYKRSNAGIEFGEAIKFSRSTNLTQLSLGYHGTFDSNALKLALAADLFYSPGKWLPNQSYTDYSQSHEGASARYLYGRFSLAPTIQLPNAFSFAFNLEGQISTENLLPSEQYGLGGHNTVRGYKERLVNTDNALFSSAELRTPPISLMKHKQHKDLLQFLVFLDYGIGRNVHQNLDKSATTYLLSYGPGIRYNVIPYITLRADLGIKLHKIESQLHQLQNTMIQECDTSRMRFHFAFVASY